MPDAYKNAARGPVELGSGRMLAPGEVVLPDDLDLEADTHDSRLLADGHLVEAVVTPDESLAGDRLLERARELGVPNRSKMSADELREAIAEREVAGGDAS